MKKLKNKYAVFVNSKNIVFVDLPKRNKDILEAILTGLREVYSVYSLIDSNKKKNED